MTSPRRVPSASLAGRSSCSTPMSHPDHRHSCTYASASRRGMRMPSWRSPSSTMTEKSSSVPAWSCWFDRRAPGRGVPAAALEDHAPHVGVDEPYLEGDLPALAARAHAPGRDGGLDEARGLVEAPRGLLLEAPAEDERLVAGRGRVPEHQRLEREDDAAERPRAQQHLAAVVDGVPVQPHGHVLHLVEQRAERRRRAGDAVDPAPRRLVEELPAARRPLDGRHDVVGQRIDATEVGPEPVDAVAEARAGLG